MALVSATEQEIDALLDTIEIDPRFRDAARELCRS